MPSRTPRLCPSCRVIVTGPCPTCSARHQRTQDKRRGSASARGYDWAWYTVTRPAFLADHPWCVLCGEPATVPDHWPETRADLVARGVSDPDSSDRMRALCAMCHQVHGLRSKITR